MPRKIRSDSVDAQVQAYRRGSETFEWPSHMIIPDGKEDVVMGIALSVFATRDPADWQAHADFATIAEYALVSADLAEVQHQVSTEGYAIAKEGSKGQTVHARHPLLDGLTHLRTSRQNLARALGLTAKVEPRETSKRGKDFNKLVGHKSNVASSLLA